MKYTMSNDGEKRCTVHLEIRLTPKEYGRIQKVAIATGSKSVKDYLSRTLLDREHLNSCIEDDEREI